MFIVGSAPRSGSSLLSTLISTHPEVAIAHDTGLFFYLKLAAIRVIGKAQTGNQISYGMALQAMSENNLTHHTILLEFLETSPSTLLKRTPENIHRQILDDWLRALWQFWVNDGNVPDPTKDRGRADAFLSQIDGQEIFNSTSMRDLIILFTRKFAISMNKKSDRRDLLVGEKTPENTLAADIAIGVYKDLKIINLLRDPVSVYASKIRRMPSLGPDDFCSWYNQLSNFAFAGDCPVLKVYYSAIIQDPGNSLQRIWSFLGVNDNAFAHTDEFIPPAHYTKYVGQRIDPSREIRLQSTLDDATKSYIRTNCIY